MVDRCLNYSLFADNNGFSPLNLGSSFSSEFLDCMFDKRCILKLDIAWFYPSLVGYLEEDRYVLSIYALDYGLSILRVIQIS